MATTNKVYENPYTLDYWDIADSMTRAVNQPGIRYIPDLSITKASSLKPTLMKYNLKFLKISNKGDMTEIFQVQRMMDIDGRMDTLTALRTLSRIALDFIIGSDEWKSL